MDRGKIIDETEKYGVVDVDEAGEIDVYERSFLWSVIRRKELAIILENVISCKPMLILDYGCGAGWLSAFLKRNGFEVVGIDISVNLLRKAKRTCHEAEFIVCDAEEMPFKDVAVDFVVGAAILHHLNLERSCKEIKRVVKNKSKFVFLEPNSLNPLSAIGRKFFPTEAHTKGEKQFVPSYLKAVLSNVGFTLERCFTLFFTSFPLARLFKIAGIRPHPYLANIVSLFENVMESIPGIKQLNSTIVAVGTLCK